jgi:hypothetical protein
LKLLATATGIGLDRQVARESLLGMLDGRRCGARQYGRDIRGNDQPPLPPRLCARLAAQCPQRFVRDRDRGLDESPVGTAL